MSALLSFWVCLTLVSPKPLPGRNQPLYPTPHTHMHTYVPWFAARILWNPLQLLPLTDFGGAQMSISGDNSTALILDTWLEWSPSLLHYCTKLLFSLIKAIKTINLINHCPNVNFIWLQAMTKGDKIACWDFMEMVSLWCEFRILSFVQKQGTEWICFRAHFLWKGQADLWKRVELPVQTGFF